MVRTNNILLQFLNMYDLLYGILENASIYLQKDLNNVGKWNNGSIYVIDQRDVLRKHCDIVNPIIYISITNINNSFQL